MEVLLLKMMKEVLTGSQVDEMHLKHGRGMMKSALGRALFSLLFSVFSFVLVLEQKVLAEVFSVC